MLTVLWYALIGVILHKAWTLIPWNVVEVWIRDGWRGLSDYDWVLESSSTFATWWKTTEVDRRKRTHVPRHSRSMMYGTGEWRVRWASHDTQAWPTLSTTGNAWDLVPALRPLICTSELWTIHIKPTICVQDLRIHSLAHIG